MKAMILAAGLGERMRPLTDHTPKPLLQAGGKPLIEHHLRRLAEAGFSEVVINVSHLAGQIIDYCGDGSHWGLSIAYSEEDAPLETAGGIIRALPLLGQAPFLVINGDIWIDYPLAQLREYDWREVEQAHLVMVTNPPQHPHGDFILEGNGRVGFREECGTGYTYAGLALYRPEFFAGIGQGKLALRPLLDAAIAAGTLGGEYYSGQWHDIGTPERLATLDAQLSV